MLKKTNSNLRKRIPDKREVSNVLLTKHETSSKITIESIDYYQNTTEGVQQKTLIWGTTRG